MTEDWRTWWSLDARYKMDTTPYRGKTSYSSKAEAEAGARYQMSLMSEGIYKTARFLGAFPADVEPDFTASQEPAP